ncbi:MAG: hypothetical protein WD157_00530 [Patescibacteria group bacterium]
MKTHTKKADGKVIEINPKDSIHHDKNQLWYIGVGILLVGFLVLTVSSRDYLLTAVVVAAAIAIFRLANLKIEKKDIALSDNGVRWGKESFGFHSFRAFWVGTHGADYTVYLDRLNWRPTISFTIEEKDVESVIDVLAQNLPFHAHRNTPLPDRFARLLKL